MAEPPTLITLVDSTLGGSAGGADNYICVGYRHQFDLVGERSGEVVKLHAVEGSRAHLVAAVDLYEDEEPELLLCYNRKLHGHVTLALIAMDILTGSHTSLLQSLQ